MSLTRLALSPRTRSAPQVASDLSPFAVSDAMWSIVRGQEPNQHVREGRSVRTEGFEVNAIVNACVRVIADQIAAVPLEAYTESSDGETQLLPKSPLQQLLNQPSAQWPGFSFRRGIAATLGLYGNAYVRLVRPSPNAAPQSLAFIHPERLQNVLIDGESDEIVAYVWNDSSGRQRVSPWTDVIHVRDLVTDPDPWFGFPRGVSALAAMASDADASTYVRQVVKNSGVPAMVLLARAGVSLEDLKKAEAQWHARMVERGERGRTRFLGAIEKVEVIGHSLKDLEFPTLRQVSREDICAAFGVDPRLIGSSSAAGKEGGMSGQQFTEARRKLEQLTCGPLRMAITDALDTVLTPEFGETYARFVPDDIRALIETPQEVATRVSTLVREGVMTIEEGRKATGAPDEMDPTHHTTLGSIRTVKAAIELSEAPPAPPMLPAPANGSAPPKDDADEKDAKRSTRRLQTRVMDRALRWRAFDVRATAQEGPFLEAAEAAFAAERDIVQRVVIAAGDAATRAEGDPSFWDRLLAAIGDLYILTGPIFGLWRRGMQRPVSITLTSAADALAAQLGISFDASNPAALEAVTRRVNKLTGNVADTTLRRLRAVILAGRDAGLGPEAMAETIAQAIFDPAITAQRALVIARTESVGALNEGEWIAAQESGVMQSKAWLDQQDAAVRESHIACGKQGWIALNEAFSNGLQYPHAPNGDAEDVVQCRCALLFSDLAPDEAEADQPLNPSAP